ncbi:MAG: agmatinase family protein [Proteobacteria bacterium]|nr:agmatinase family protein [Pseudomonadota bacterium]MDA0992746.1 agmatinase family protein [Pseudomonadota bacterium]
MKHLIRRVFAAVAILALCITAFAQDEDEFEPVDLPDDIAAKVSDLPQEKVDFLRGDGIFGFAERHELLFDRLDSKTPAQIEAYIDAMMRVTELMKFNPDTDMASIPLNTESDGFNAWKTRRPAEFDTPREAGPINVNRYLSAGPKQGIPTFFNLPIAMTPEDLVAGEVDIAIMGAGLDMGSGYRGAAYGPRALRTAEIYINFSMSEPQHMHTMVSEFNELVMVDYGDIAIDGMSTERSLEHIREVVREVASTGTIPFIVGGDHSLMYPDVAGVVDAYGVGKVGIVHFDAHYDAGGGSAHLISHGQPVRRLFDEKLVPGKNFIQVGLRGSWPSNRGFEWMRENGLRYHTMAEIEKNGWEATMDRVLDEALDGPEFIFISFDIDVLDPSFTPGTGTPEPAGLTTREVFPIVRNLCAMNKIVGFELVEVNPLVDPGYTTAMNAARVMRECLNGIALRKRGLTEKNYLSPLTTEHGHDE